MLKDKWHARGCTFVTKNARKKAFSLDKREKKTREREREGENEKKKKERKRERKEG